MQFITRFIGLNADNVHQLQYESSFIYQTVVQLPNKKIGFEVTHNG